MTEKLDSAALPSPQTPVEVALGERSKKELLVIIAAYRENLQWYVDERNRLIAEVAELRETIEAKENSEDDINR